MGNGYVMGGLMRVFMQLARGLWLVCGSFYYIRKLSIHFFVLYIYLIFNYYSQGERKKGFDRLAKNTIRIVNDVFPGGFGH